MPVIRSTIGRDGKTGGTGEDGVADAAPIPQAGARVRRLVLLGLVVLAFCGSLLASKSLFPLGSINHDEQMYVVEAQMLRQGHVTLPTHQAEFFRPWAAGISRGRVVLSYTPPWPAVIAASDVVLGTNRAAPAAIAAALVIAVYLLAVEVSDRWRVGLIAAAVFALSPMVVFLSGTYLPYSFQLLVQVLFAYLVLSGIRLGSAPRLVLAGLAFGVAAFARPFDALLVGLPFLAVVVVTGRRDWRTLLRRVASLFVGVAPLLVLNLWLNAHTMGSPLRSPFTITGSHNTFGFGRRGVFDTSTIEYGPQQAFGSLKNLVVLPGWTFGGLIAVVLAAIGLVLSVRSRRRLPAVVAVAAVAGTVTVGYFFFWSPYAIVHEWPGAATLGPFYHLSLLVPVALFAAVALDRAIDIHPRVAVAGLAIAMVALTLALLPSKLSDNRDVTRDYRVRPIASSRVQPPAVVFLSEGRDQGFESTTPFLQNRPDLTGPVLYGSDLSGRDLALLHAMPSRKPYRFVYEAGSDRDIFTLHPSLTESRPAQGQGRHDAPSPAQPGRRPVRGRLRPDR